MSSEDQVITTPIIRVNRLCRRADTDELWSCLRLACNFALVDAQAFVAILVSCDRMADASVLSCDEKVRAGRYRQPKDAVNFVLGRTLVHQLLLESAIAEALLIPCGLRGKPFIEGGPAFNLSHSGEYVVLAVSKVAPVGVDVETSDTQQLLHELLPLIAHPAEKRVLSACAQDAQVRMYRRMWTRKEALLKAIGVGVSDAICSINVQLDQACPIVEQSESVRLVDLIDYIDVCVTVAIRPYVRAVSVVIVD